MREAVILDAVVLDTTPKVVFDRSNLKCLHCGGTVSGTVRIMGAVGPRTGYLCSDECARAVILAKDPRAARVLDADAERPAPAREAVVLDAPKAETPKVAPVPPENPAPARRKRAGKIEKPSNTSQDVRGISTVIVEAPRASTVTKKKSAAGISTKKKDNDAAGISTAVVEAPRNGRGRPSDPGGDQKYGPLRDVVKVLSRAGARQRVALSCGHESTVKTGMARRRCARCRDANKPAVKRGRKKGGGRKAGRK